MRARVRTPYLNGKLERAFRTFKLWWRVILPACTCRGLQRRLDAYEHWYNQHRPHSALGVLTPQEVWEGRTAPPPVPIRAADPHRVRINVSRHACRGDPRLRIVHITVQRQAA